MHQEPMANSEVVLRVTKNKAYQLSKIGSKNPNWIGDKVGISGVHGWVKRRLKKPELCTKCKADKVHDLANISQKYLRNLTDWEWLCRKCHMTKDGRMKNLFQYSGRIKKPMKYSEEIYASIRNDFDNGTPMKVIAEKYNMLITYCYRINKYRTSKFPRKTAKKPDTKASQEGWGNEGA